MGKELPVFKNLPNAQSRLRNIISGSDSDAADPKSVPTTQWTTTNPPSPCEIVTSNSTKQDLPLNPWNQWQHKE
jgi:hypothetical protein